MIKIGKSKINIGLELDALLVKQLKEQASLSDLTLVDLVEEILQGWIIDQIGNYEYKEILRHVSINDNLDESTKIIEMWVDKVCLKRTQREIINK